MSEDKPLHVRVAEALGCTSAVLAEGKWYCKYCEPGHGSWTSGTIPRYDTDWSAAGPLIERFQIHLRCDGEIQRPWTACLRDEQPVSEQKGDTPLIAICNLIVQRHRAGLLPNPMGEK